MFKGQNVLTLNAHFDFQAITKILVYPAVLPIIFYSFMRSLVLNLVLEKVREGNLDWDRNLV